MKAWLGVAIYAIRIYGATSLKDRRQVVRSIVDRIKKHYNASVADLGPDGVWDRVDLAVTCVGSSHQEMASRVDQLSAFISHAEDEGEFEVTNLRQEVFLYGDIQNRSPE